MKKPDDSHIKCVYGLPSPEIALQLNQWLLKQKGRSVIVIEDEPETLFERLDEGYKVYFLGENNEEQLFNQIAWDFLFLPLELVETPGNSSKSKERLKEIFQKLSDAELKVNLLASDYKERGLNILKNLVGNKAPAIKGSGLFGAFKGIPALICGGGLSLEKKGETLKKLKDRALIFSGGAGLNLLSGLAVKPHFAGGIDPNPSAARFLSQSFFEIPLFYQSRFNAGQLKYWQGERLWIEGSGGYPIEEWLYGSESYDGGWNVVTFLTSLAYELGCNPIILSGVDLGSKQKRLYGSKVEQSEDEAVEFRDEEGKIFYSKRDWIMAAKWLGAFAGARPETLWINSSEGMKLKGFVEKPLDSLELQTRMDLDGLVHREIQNLTTFSVDQKQFDLLDKSLDKTAQLCGEMLQVMEKYFPQYPQGKKEYLLLAVELDEEVAYQKFLLPIWDVWKYILKREAYQGVPEDYGIELHRWLFMREICNEARQISN